MARNTGGNEGGMIEEVVDPMGVNLNLPPISQLEYDDEVLSDLEEHVRVIEKGDLIGLNREFDYSDRFCPSQKDLDLSEIMNEDGIVDISNMNFNKILIDNFSDEVNEILGPLSTPDLINETILIIRYKYHAGLLEYLVHNV